MIKQLMKTTAACVVVATATAAAADGVHEGDIIVGITGDTSPQLMVEGPFEIEGGEEHIHVLLQPSSGVYTGYTLDEPGFDALGTDEPDESFYKLGDGASISFRVLSIDSGIVVRQASDGALLADAVDDEVSLGDHELHTHFVFHAENASLGDLFEMEIELFDTGTTGYGNSETIAFEFEAVPEPGSLALLGLGGLALITRRRAHV